MTDEKLVFAYGSLVNSRARPARVRGVPAVLSGWVRQWKHRVETPAGKVCALTVSVDPRFEIRGIALFCDVGIQAELGQREVGYSLIPVSIGVGSRPPHIAKTEAFTFVSEPSHHRPASIEFPIWRSYLDCVLIGYLELGGPQGVRDFITSTEGWNAPILDDRSCPKYARAIDPTAEQKCEIDKILDQHGLLRNLVA